MQTRSVLPFIISTYVTATILRPVLASKIFAVGICTFPGSLIIFPLSFVCNDIFSEVYGFAQSRSIVRAGLISQLLSCAVIALVVAVPGAPFWHGQESFEMVLGQNIRIAAASLLGCYFGELTNSMIVSRMKHRKAGACGRFLMQRFVYSTILGEAVDSVLFISIAFIGIHSPLKILSMILTTWVVKTLYEIALLPVSMHVVQLVKRFERVDVIDDPQETDYSIIGSVKVYPNGVKAEA